MVMPFVKKNNGGGILHKLTKYMCHDYTFIVILVSMKLFEKCLSLRLVYVCLTHEY